MRTPSQRPRAPGNSVLDDDVVCRHTGSERSKEHADLKRQMEKLNHHISDGCNEAKAQDDELRRSEAATPP